MHNMKFSKELMKGSAELIVMQALKEDELIDLLIELCDIFDMYRPLTAQVAALYKEHRRSTGSLEDRDWPDN